MLVSTPASASQLQEAHPGRQMPHSSEQTPPAFDGWQSASSGWSGWSAPNGWSDWSTGPDYSENKWTAPDLTASRAVSFAVEPQVETPGYHIVKSVELVTFAEDAFWCPPKTSANLTIKAKNLFDPAGSRHHTGAHPKHLEQLLKQGNLRGHFQTIKKWLRNQMASKQMPLYVGIWCKRGKHRSVGLATLVEHCLLKAEGCKVEVTHMAAGYFNCGRQGACIECTGHELCSTEMKQLRDECFCAAAEMWQQA